MSMEHITLTGHNQYLQITSNSSFINAGNNYSSNYKILLSYKHKNAKYVLPQVC
jgi:hypothetical protein